MSQLCQMAAVRASRRWATRAAQAGAPAVRLEPELALEGHPTGTGPDGDPEGVDDGLDALADPAQLAGAPPLVAAVRSDQSRAEFADEVLELLAGVSLIGHDEQARPLGRVLQSPQRPPDPRAWGRPEPRPPWRRRGW